jgi:malonyl CoA-acyl carrier protein transacylase
MLLSLQVSSALSWIDSGLEIDTLLGHSFGQLSALVVAGSMSLEDGFRFVAGRARLIRDKWGSEQGAMVSLECDRSELEMIMNLTNATDDSRIELACENGPRSFVLAGSVASVDKVEDICRSRGLRTTRLQNTHAYHSYIADAILPDLWGIAQSIAIRTPTIPVETCSAGEAWRQFDAEQLVQHTRQPVYFKDAVQRLTSRLASAIWLEAGSASPVIAMARRVVSRTRPAGKSPDIFVPVDLSSLDSGAYLAHAACQLWRAGCATQYWSFCRPANHSYSVDIALPPYQFDQTRHWIEYKHRSTQKANTKSDRNGLLKTAELVKLVENGRLSSSETLFVVNTSTLLFQLAARGHAVARQALCPASMYLEIAARCATLISDKSGQTVPHIESLTMSAPLGLSSESIVFLCLRRILGDKPGWEFTILSQPSSAGTGLARDTSTQHAKGLITLVPAGDLVAENRLSLLTKFFRYSRAEHIMSLPAASGVHGPMVYKLFSEVVDYAEYYRGVSSLSAHQNEAAGLVTPSAEVPLGLDAGICDPVAMDNFLQVAGIHVNCLSPRKNGQVFMCTAVDEVIFTPAFLNLRDRREGSGSPAAWTVYTRYEMTSSLEMENNICVYDTKSKTPVVVILGAVFKAVPLKSLERSLTRLNCVATATDLNTRPAPTRWNSCSSSSEPPSRDSGYDTLAASPCPSVELEKKTGLPFPVQPEPTGTVAPFDKPKKPSPSKPEDSGVVKRLCEMFSSILEIPIDEIQPTSTLDELGVDSLLATEVLNEMQMRFDVRISQAQLQQCPDVFRLASMIQPADSGVQLGSGTVQLGPLQSKLVGGSDSGVEGLSPDDECSASSESSDFDAPPKQDMNLASLCRDTFMQTKQSFDKYADSTLFSGFCTAVHPLQSQLVVQYVVTAFASLGCDLGTLSVGDELPSFGFDARHSKLIPQLYRVLQDAGLISKRDAGFEFCRTAVPIPSESAPALHQRMLDQFPQHASETKLLHTTADKLADCLSGREDPIALIFRDADARSLLEDVYTNAPMFKTGTLVLSEYLSSVLTRLATCTTGSNSNLNRPIHILELGAGTGGTTKHIVSTLSSLDLPFKFHYTFTDLSASLVAAAKRKFSQWSSFMSYTTLDVEKEPPPHLHGAFDIVLSTNCIHATQELIQSTTNIRKMLRQDGVLCLVELTRNLYWFDLVFGLLEGWWRFTDGREHALADEERWERDLRKAGFEWVDWTGGETEESDILRVITASPCKSDPGQPLRGITVGAEGVPSGTIEGEGGIQRETVTFKSVDGLDLLAEIYYPPEQDLVTGKSLPVGKTIPPFPSPSSNS